MSHRSSVALLFALVAATLAPTAEAYIGPGAGVSMVGALWSVIVGIVVVVGAILTWPLRILWKRMKRGKSGATPTDDGERR